MPSLGTIAASIGGGIKRGAMVAGGAGILAKRALMGNPYGRAALIGAGVGGVYGGLSDNGSVLGGMAKGAALGVGARAGYGMGRAGMGMYNLARGMGMGKGKAAAVAFEGIGRGAAAFAGSTLTKAVNPIRAFFPRFSPGL